MKNKLIIIGASGHGGVVADLAELLGYSVCFWDDDVNKNLPVYFLGIPFKLLLLFSSLGYFIDH